MFEKVLVALDFSAHSEHIPDHILELPGIREAVLLHIVDASHESIRGWTHGPEIENAKLLMAEKKEALEKAGLTVHIHVEVLVDVITRGNVAGEILKIAKEWDVSLIVVGERATGPLREFFVGSTSVSVIRHATESVLVLHAPGTTEAGCGPCPPPAKLFSRVLVPTDFSPDAGLVFAFIRAIPAIGETILLNVVDRPDAEPEIEAAVADVQSRLDAMKKEFSPDVSLRTHIRVGDPAGMILSVADEDDVSLIAMSAYGTGRLRDMLPGSTTLNVVRATKKPVLVIRTPNPVNSP